MTDPHWTGSRGCSAMTKRGGTERHCHQRAIHVGKDGREYCYYHNPEKPRKFGEGYKAPGQWDAEGGERHG